MKCRNPCDRSGGKPHKTLLLCKSLVLDADRLGNWGTLFLRPSLLKEGGGGCVEWEDDADYEINGVGVHRKSTLWVVVEAEAAC